MNQKLQGKIAVVTGGNSGIGLAAAHEFARQGARVVIVGRNAGAVDQAAREVGHDAVGFAADVARVADLEHAFAAVREAAGRVDILFVNAGIAKFAPLAEATESMFDEMTDANLKGAYFTLQRALPVLADGASVIFTSSTAVHFGMPGASIYAAGKAALNSLAKTLSVELAPRKIRVNVVSPGPIATPLFGKMGLPTESVNQMAAGILAQVPLNRFGQPEEVAKAVAFLASDDAAYVTGAELLIDGGMASS